MPPRKRRQRGYIEQLPSGNYRAVAYAGVDLLTRRPRYHRKTVKTYDDAKKALVKLQSEIDEDRAPSSATATPSSPPPSTPSSPPTTCRSSSHQCGHRGLT